jgi:hypothetical protein
LHSHVSSQHHHGGLGIGARGLPKRGPVDDAKRLHAHDAVVRVDDLPDEAAAMVVPDGDDAVEAPVSQIDRVLGRVAGVALRPGGQHGVAHWPQEQRHGVVRVLQPGQGGRRDGVHGEADASLARRQVRLLLEVVESHARILARVQARQPQQPPRLRPPDLLQHGAAPRRPRPQRPARRAQDRSDDPRLQNLRRDPPLVNLALVLSQNAQQRLRLPAGDFDVAPEARDAHHLDQRHFDLLAREHPERVRRIVRHLGSHRWILNHGRDVELRQVVRRADAAQHEQLRAAERSRRDDHLAPRVRVAQKRGVIATLQIRVRHSDHPRTLCEDPPQQGSEPI